MVWILSETSQNFVGGKKFPTHTAGKNETYLCAIEFFFESDWLWNNYIKSAKSLLMSDCVYNFADNRNYIQKQVKNQHFTLVLRFTWKLSINLARTEVIQPVIQLETNLFTVLHVLIYIYIYVYYNITWPSSTLKMNYKLSQSLAKI